MRAAALLAGSTRAPQGEVTLEQFVKCRFILWWCEVQRGTLGRRGLTSSQNDSKEKIQAQIGKRVGTRERPEHPAAPQHPRSPALQQSRGASAPSQG